MDEKALLDGKGFSNKIKVIESLDMHQFKIQKKKHEFISFNLKLILNIQKVPKKLRFLSSKYKYLPSSFVFYSANNSLIIRISISNSSYPRPITYVCSHSNNSRVDKWFPWFSFLNAK